VRYVSPSAAPCLATYCSTCHHHYLLRLEFSCVGALASPLPFSLACAHHHEHSLTTPPPPHTHTHDHHQPPAAAQDDASAQRSRANRLIQEAESVRTELSSVAKDLRTRSATAEALADESSKRVRQLESDLKARDYDVCAVLDKCSALTAAKDSLQSHNNSLQTQNDSLQIQNHSLQTQVTDLSESIAAAALARFAVADAERDVAEEEQPH
jgi:chaperonin cofactor prefoldin